MKAMILAAGRGERMRPLTDYLPKPMLKVAGKSLIEHHIVALQRAGITDIVINLAWLGDKIQQYLQDGSDFGVTIRYSHETTALETAGGIKQALPMLGDQPFVVVNGDVYTDFDFSQLATLRSDVMAHLYLIDNPVHNPGGDFAIENGYLTNLTQCNEHSATFSGIGVYRAEFFDRCQHQVQALGPMLRAGAERKLITAEMLAATWTDVGTPERLQQLNAELLAS